jgi:hypothetical protein
MTDPIPTSLQHWRAELSAADRRVAGLESELESAKADADTIRQIVTSIESLARRRGQIAGQERLDLPEPVKATGDTIIASVKYAGPRGVDPIRRVLSEDPSRIWTVPQMVTELESRGWIDPSLPNPRRAVNNALMRLVTKHGEARREGHGRYRFRAPDRIDDLPSFPTTEGDTG